MEDSIFDRRVVFRGAVSLALRDGQLSNGEKRLLMKLAYSLKLDDEEPKMIYDSIVDNVPIGIGKSLSEEEQRLVYGQVLEAMLIHTDRSDDELMQIAYLRKIFSINDSEHRAITRSMDRQLEEVIHRTFKDEVRIRLYDSIDRMGDILDSILIRKEDRK
ncbi:MAG: hypothetical protein HOJ64_06650 [Euryarchaeota archaeon]|jgi:hypothetical protein|nr:hypothetical protein [Euryarchaeota archaeon]MBT4391395.1 hypothetical protein [Euryarchaeota archaeon]MBT4803312.1 hypothetical protein [Euryarchaeota archaeon]MBT5614536.1 hypothetical protein [Euryarchaeota archaeon]MBT6683831.1 hypothetical protein [Euryarchaeota archaeon]